MKLIRSEKSEHYYTPDGKPFYEVPNKSKPGEFRPVDIRDAKKVGAYPSITTIIGMLVNPRLETWKQEQIILSAWKQKQTLLSALKQEQTLLSALKQMEEETLEDFSHKTIEDAQKQSKDAAGIGSEVHSYLEACITKQDKPQINNELQKALDEWLKENLFDGKCEKIVIDNTLKMGGRIDFIGSFKAKGWDRFYKCILDFKTQGTKKDKKINVYDSWSYQLGGYGLMSNDLFDKYINIVISSSEIGRIEMVEWDNSDIGKAMRIVKNLRELFKDIRDL